MTADALVESIALAGGVLKLEGDRVKCWLPKSIAHIAGDLRERKPEVIASLQRRGGWAATFPRCPRCASYALYRKNNVGAYECQSCGLGKIEEGVARRACQSTER